MIKKFQSLRKFGLDYHDLPTVLRNVTIMLEHLTLDVDPRNKKPVGILPYIWMIIFLLCYHYIYFVSMIWFVFVRCRQTGNVLAALVVFSLGMISQMSNLKLVNLIAYRKELRQLVVGFLACDALVVPDTRFALNLKTKMREVKKRALTLFVVVMVNATLYISKRFFIIGLEDTLELYGFENMSKTGSTPAHVFIFMMDLISVYGVCYTSSAITSLFIILSGYIEAQMLALSHELTNVWEDALAHCNDKSIRIISHIRRPSRPTNQLEDTETPVFLCDDYAAKIDGFETVGDFNATNISKTSTKKNISKMVTKMYRQDALNKYVTNRLADISKSHSINLNLAYNVEVVFRIAIALEFLVLSIGLIACLLAGLENSYIELPLILMSVGIDCTTGQLVIDASKIFENAVYDSKWENFDVINRKIILLMLRVSQRTLRLSAGTVTTLSLECFMNVLRTIFSAYTTLRSTMK